MMKREIESIFYSTKFFRDSKFLEDTLNNSELYFSQLSDFNDPYENIYHITSNEYKNIILKSAGINIPYEQNEFAYLFNLLEMRLKILLLDKLGICCFTSMPDNHLMWSHYADSHKGCALIFDFSENDFYSKRLTGVDYQENTPSIDLFETNNIINEDSLLDKKIVDQLLDAIHTKSKLWEYEHEHRVVSIDYGLKKFEPKLLKLVVFGAKMPIERKEYLSSIIKGTYPETKIIEARLNNNFYYIHFNLYDTKEEIMFIRKDKKNK